MKTALDLAGVASMIAAGSSPAAAQELIVAAGYTQFSNNFSIDSPQVSLEYLHSPFYDAGRFEVALAAIALAHSSGDVFLGGGLSARYTFHPRWFIDVSVMPGAYWENQQANGLGSTFEIRSQLALGYTLKSGDRISVGISHKSNASTAEVNPGVNSLTAQWHFTF
jgi:lipid A 3-O-deacylase